MWQYNGYRSWLWRTIAYLAAATVAGISVVSSAQRGSGRDELER